MDYGQDTNMNNRAQFGMTAGIGMAPENTNPLDQSENLNTEGFQASNRTIGRAGLESFSIPANDLPDPNAPQRTVELHVPSESNSTSDAERFGEIIDLSMPPLANATRINQPLPNQPTPADSTQNQTPSNQYTPEATDPDIARHFADGKINGDDIPHIKSKENKLSQDGDAAAFLDWWKEARLDAINGQNGGKKAA